MEQVTRLELATSTLARWDIFYIVIYAYFFYFEFVFYFAEIGFYSVLKFKIYVCFKDIS